MTGTNLYPYSSVVFISDVIGGVGYRGSGVLIAPDEVLTASHVVWEAGVGLASSVTVTPGYNAGYAPFGSIDADYAHYEQVGNGDGTISRSDSQYDYALVHLSHPVSAAGTMGITADYGGGVVNVTGYPGSAGESQVQDVQRVTRDASYSLFDGRTLGPGSSGGPVWITDAGGHPSVVGLTSSGFQITGYFTQLTAAATATIRSWLAEDAAMFGGGSAVALTVYDTTANAALPAPGEPYSGPVPDIATDYINLTADNINVAAGTGGWFIHTGSGSDAVQVSSGRNVVDGGTGSNFLTGGSGFDSFFVDDRGPAADIWSTVASFSAGETATIWGVSQATDSLSWADGQGASGYTGLTAHFTRPGAPTASITLGGYNAGDLQNGHLAVSYGFDSASNSPFMYIVAQA